MQVPRIIKSTSKKLVGLSLEMSYANNLTGKLWGQFMPRRNEILIPVSQDKFSLQIFQDDFDWHSANEHTVFIKWAAMEVSNHDQVPDGMKMLNLSGGTYAVFIHRGFSSQFPATLEFILKEWLPSSGYEPDYSRPQYEVLGEKYINNHPDSEEEVWFPIKHTEI